MKNITKNRKTILFASLIVATILLFSEMNFTKAQLDDKERVLQKQIDIENNFNKFLELQEKSDEIQAEIYRLQEQHDQDNAIQLEALEKKMDAIQEELEKNQKKHQKLYEIPQEKTDKLLSAMDRIKQEFTFSSDVTDESQLNGMFVDSAKELIVVLKNLEYTTPQVVESRDAISVKNFLVSSTSIESEIKSTVGDEVEVIITYMQDQSHKSYSNCNYNSERDDYCQPAAGGVKISSGGETPQRGVETSTLSFPATQKDGDSGFVMVAHGLSEREQEPIGSKVYQPNTNQIGTVDTYHYDMDKDCDCAFIKLSAGRTVANEVAYNSSFLLTINDFKYKWQTSVGTTIMMSGKSSDVQWGTIISRYNHDTDWVFADYTAIVGDSGAPVGKVSGGNIDIYGIHKGNSQYGGYEAYVPYDNIESELDLQ